jgi:hypothetical protein
MVVIIVHNSGVGWVVLFLFTLSSRYLFFFTEIPCAYGLPYSQTRKPCHENKETQCCKYVYTNYCDILTSHNIIL